MIYITILGNRQKLNWLYLAIKIVVGKLVEKREGFVLAKNCLKENDQRDLRLSDAGEYSVRSLIIMRSHLRQLGSTRAVHKA